MKKRIGKYELLGPLGAGGMALVYKARDTSLDRVVALKLIRQQLDGGETARKRFLNEAKVLAGLQHSNIVFVYDFGLDEGSPYIVMEYLPGADLHEIIHKRYALSLEQKLKIAVQVAKALRAAHAQGVVHRDIKPSNIRVLQDGVAKLVDFGIATISSPDFERLTQTGAVLGSIRYMAPEQVHGHVATPASDLFSFGAVLYELLTYRQAFPGESLGAVISAISNEKPLPIDDPEVPGSLKRLLKRCLQKAPQDRYASAAELVVAFAEVEEELWQRAVLEGRTQVGRMLLADATPLPEPAEQDTVIVGPAPASGRDTLSYEAAPPEPEDLDRPTRDDPAPWKKPTRKVPTPDLELVPAPRPPRRGLRAAVLGIGLLAAAAASGWWLLGQPGPPEPAEPEVVVLQPVGTAVPGPAEAETPAEAPTAVPVPTPSAAPQPAEPLTKWLAALRSPRREERVEAARALAAGGRAAVPLLIAALKGPEAEVRILAATALGQIGSAASSAVPALNEALRDGDPLVRVWVNYALARIDWMDPAAVSELRKSAQEGSEPVRAAAARALQDLQRGRP
jgi:serine/threonine-protein kinase